MQQPDIHQREIIPGVPVPVNNNLRLNGRPASAEQTHKLQTPPDWKDITHEVEYLVVAGIGFFCLFGVLHFHELIEKGAFHLPSFQNLVNLFLVVFTEEVMYRYYIHGADSETFSKYRALLIASLLFTLIHSGRLSGMYYIYIFIGSLVFGYGYMRNQNLSVPLILHSLVNLFPMILL